MGFLEVIKVIPDILVERRISKMLDKHLDRREYKKILSSISIFQEKYADSEIDRKSFQDFLLMGTTRCSLYRFVYEKYYSEIPSEKEEMISNLVTDSMFYINKQNIKYKRPLFQNDSLLVSYFTDLLGELYERLYSEMTLESKKQLTITNTLLDKKFEEAHYRDDIKLSRDFLTRELRRSIINLGDRYTSNFNIETENKWALESLGQSNDFIVKLNDLRDRALDSYLKLYDRIIGKEKYSSIPEFIKITSTDILETLEKPITYTSKINDIRELLKSIEFPDVYWIESLSREEKSLLRYFIESVENDFSELLNILSEQNIELIDKPYLLITGNAGIGKSHLLADYAKKYTERGHATFLFLGSYFYNDSDPRNQMMESLQLQKFSLRNLLEKLENKASESGARSIIFIDALNEGAGLGFWQESLSGLIQEIQEYPNVGLVLSVRTEYLNFIIPTDFPKLNFQEMKHTGLEGRVNDSIKQFCKYYNLAYPTVPVFNEEFNNPLFLKMVCRLLIESSISQFSSTFSIEEIMNHYVDTLERTLSAKKRLDCDYRRQIVKESVSCLAGLKIENEWSTLEYNETYDRLCELGSRLAINSAGNILKELISEGLLQVIKVGGNKTFLDFQFQKFSDYFIADYIYQIYIIEKNLKDLSKDEELSFYFKNDVTLGKNYGVLVMFSTKLANHNKKDINSYLPKTVDSELIFQVICDSLVYRNATAISDEFVEYVESKIATKPSLMKYFVSSQFQLATEYYSPINSQWLHSFLAKMTQQEIDLIWTINISKSYRTFVSEFSIWYRTSYKYSNRRDAELILLQLGWILSSTNRYYRDQATIAIVKILNEDSNLIEFFLQKFYNVNDRYVVERAMAAVYGATINLVDSNKIGEISKLVYEMFFNVEFVLPHVLARDYGRQIISFAIYNKSLDEKQIDLTKVYPQYQEKWNYNQITDEKIDELKQRYEEHSGFNSIVRSMMTNFGRARGSYGNFGRYTFQSALSPWKTQFDIQDLSNFVIVRCLELGYSPELFSEYDTLDGRYFGRASNKEERIGKKYQWIAFHEILANISDNFIPYTLENVYDDEYIYYKNKEERFIEIQEAFKTNDFSMIFNNEKDECDEERHIIERKKIYQEKWKVTNYHLRDIDVSVVDENLPATRSKLFEFSLPDYLTEQWIKEKIDKNTLESFLTTEVDSNNYYTLSFYNDDLREKKDTDKGLREKNDNLTIMGRAVFVKKTLIDAFHEEVGDNGGDVSSPTTRDVFLREYYWSEVYQNWEKEISDYEGDSRNYIHASHCYGWEKADQHTSLNEELSNELLSLLMPSQELVEFGKLKMDGSFVWKNEDNEEISFDARSIGKERVLLCRKDFIDSYCLQNDCVIVWMCYYDKIGLNQYHDSHYYFVKENNSYHYYEQDERVGTFDF